MSLLDKFKKKSKSASAKVAASKTETKKKTKAVQPASVKVAAGKQAAWAYRIIKEPRVTEKATILSEQGKYIFNVYPRANKSEIKKAVQALYQVKVKSINLIHAPAKKRRIGRSEGYRHGLKKGLKKAIVTLYSGERIEIVSR